MASSTDECDPRAAAVPAPRPARVFGMDLGAAGRAPGRGAGVVAAGLAGRPAAAGRRPPGLHLGRVADALGAVRAGAVASSGQPPARWAAALRRPFRRPPGPDRPSHTAPGAH